MNYYVVIMGSRNSIPDYQGMWIGNFPNDNEMIYAWKKYMLRHQDKELYIIDVLNCGNKLPQIVESPDKNWYKTLERFE
jgi:hypothetical protein